MLLTANAVAHCLTGIRVRILTEYGFVWNAHKIVAAISGESGEREEENGADCELHRKHRGTRQTCYICKILITRGSVVM